MSSTKKAKMKIRFPTRKLDLFDELGGAGGGFGGDWNFGGIGSLETFFFLRVFLTLFTTGFLVFSGKMAFGDPIVLIFKNI